MATEEYFEQLMETLTRDEERRDSVANVSKSMFSTFAVDQANYSELLIKNAKLNSIGKIPSALEQIEYTVQCCTVPEISSINLFINHFMKEQTGNPKAHSHNGYDLYDIRIKNKLAKHVGGDGEIKLFVIEVGEGRVDSIELIYLIKTIKRRTSDLYQFTLVNLEPITY